MVYSSNTVAIAAVLGVPKSQALKIVAAGFAARTLFLHAANKLDPSVPFSLL